MSRPIEQPTLDASRLPFLRTVVKKLAEIDGPEPHEVDAKRVAELAAEFQAFGRFAHRPGVTVSGRILHGRTRIAAARAAGASVIEIDEYADRIRPEVARELALSENLVRAKYAPSEEARMRAEFAELLKARTGGSEIRLSPPKARGRAQAPETRAAADAAGVTDRTVRTDRALAAVFTPSMSLELDEAGWTKAERVKLAKRLSKYPAGPIRGQVFAGALSARRDEERVAAAREKAEEDARPKVGERKDLAGRVLPPTAIARWAEASEARAIYVAISDDLDGWDKFAEGASTFTDKVAAGLREQAGKFVSWLRDRLGHAWCPDCQGSGKRPDGRACKTCHARGFLTEREWDLRAGEEAGGRDDD